MIFIYIIIVVIFATTSYFLKKVSFSGAVAGVMISFLILWNNWVNFILFGLFFILGSVATKWQFERKRQLKVLQENILKENKIASAMVLRLKLMAGLDISEKRLPQDGRITIKTNTDEFTGNYSISDLSFPISTDISLADSFSFDFSFFISFSANAAMFA